MRGVGKRQEGELSIKVCLLFSNVHNELWDLNSGQLCSSKFIRKI